jgi:uncharacterized membrane protein YbhN (UPF0104 family)
MLSSGNGAASEPRGAGRDDTPETPTPEGLSGSPRGSLVRTIVGTLVRAAGTVLLLAFALSTVKWSDLAARLQTADWRWWMAGLAAGVLVQVAAAVRWSALARPIGFRLPTTTFIRRFFEGSFFSLCLPGSIGGDVIKAFRMSDSTTGRLLAGCTILADRFTGFAALAVLAATALLVQRYHLETWAALGVGGLLLAAVMVPLGFAVGMLDKVLAWLPEHHRLRRFLGHLLPYQMRPSLLMRAVGWSMIVQMGGAFAVSLVGRSVGVHLPLATWFGSIPLVSLAMVLPISISGVGVREGGLAVLLEPHGVARDQAVAIGLLWFLTTIVCGLIGGACFLGDRRPVTVPLAQLAAARSAPPG